MLAALCGCAGAGLTAGDTGNARLAGSSGQLLPHELPLEQRMAAWQALELNPGVPGKDYDPHHITVHYLPAAGLGKLPLAAGTLPAGSRAADQPNAILRENQQYEPVTDAIAAAYGLAISQQVYLGPVNLAAFELPAGADGTGILARLRQDFAGSVESAGFSRLFHADFAVNDPDYNASTTTSGPQWGHRRIGCSAAWDYTTGDPSVEIAVVDTGVRITHQELSETVLDPAVAFPSQKLDVYNNDNTVDDTNGHGTFIAGLIGAKGNNARTLAGVAFNCRIIPIKVANTGSTLDAAIYAGCMLGFQLGAKVINLSWGNTVDDPNLEVMVNYIKGNGGLFIGAAGNDGVQTINYPAGYPAAVAVGATDPGDARSSFSQYGNWVDIAAPGQVFKSTGWSADNAYDPNESGTSFAAPLVAAAAALLWSYQANLTNSEVRALLIDYGKPTTGFGAAVPRLDIAASLEATGVVHVNAPVPDKLVSQGLVTLTPTVYGTPEAVQAFLNGVPSGTKTAAPFSFALDTSGTQFGMVNTTFTATQGADQSSASLPILVDNTTGAYPLTESFENSYGSLMPLDLKGYAQNVVVAMKTIPGPGANWTMDDIASNGPAEWSLVTGGSDGAYCAYLGTPDQTYGAYEIDALVSKQIDLTGIANPTLVYYQRYNIEDGGQQYDRAYVLVSVAGTSNIYMAQLNGGAGNALFSGYQSAWTRVEINLAPYSGKHIRLMFVFESDPMQSGEQSAEPAGWWVDDVVVSNDYFTDLPSVGGINLADGSVAGEVPGLGTLNLSIVNPLRVNRIRYILDLAPLGTINVPPDVVLTEDASPFDGSLSLAALPNQQAVLRVMCFDAAGHLGPELTVPFYIFNLRGDANADNLVDQADLDLIKSKNGLASGSAGYSPFCDSNLDGVIDEQDIAAVGYFWGGSL